MQIGSINATNTNVDNLNEKTSNNNIGDKDDGHNQNKIGSIRDIWKDEELKERFFAFLKSTAPVRNDPPLFDILIHHIDKNLFKISNGQLYDELHKKIIESEELQKEIHGVFDKRTWILRAKGRVKQIMRLIPNYYKPQRILDIGCSEGSITSELARVFNLDVDDVFGLDVRKDKQLGKTPTKEKISNGDGYPFTFVLVNPGEKLPFDDESISLVTVMMVLHHINDPINTLKEIYRVLEPGGYIVYREHDCGSPYRDGIETDHERFSQFLDVVHGMYSCVLSSPREMSGEEFFKTFYSRYYNSMEWEEMVRKVGFENKYEDKHVKKNDIMASYCVSFKKPGRKRKKNIKNYGYHSSSEGRNHYSKSSPYKRRYKRKREVYISKT